MNGVCMFLCVYRGRIGVYHLPGGNIYASRLDLLGHPVLHHVADFGHRQRSESKHPHDCRTEHTHYLAAKGKSRNSRSMKTEMCIYSWWICALTLATGSLDLRKYTAPLVWYLSQFKREMLLHNLWKFDFTDFNIHIVILVFSSLTMDQGTSNKKSI